ncbi:hypothetical protein QJQ45_030226, partial [Haematococcus lacustris]
VESYKKIASVWVYSDSSGATVSLEAGINPVADCIRLSCLAAVMDSVGKMAGKILVSVLDASNKVITSEPLSYSEQPKPREAITQEIVDGGYGLGTLHKEDGDVVMRGDLVTAGNYTYRMTGAQHLGQSTFRRGITQVEVAVEASNKQLEAVVEASNNQLREDMARSNRQHREDMARIQNEANAPQGSLRLSLVSTGALPKWWVLGLRLIFVSAGPLACVAYQLTVEEQGTSVWATSMYSLLAQAVQMILLVVAMCSFFSLRFRAGCFKWATGAASQQRQHRSHRHR